MTIGLVVLGCLVLYFLAGYLYSLAKIYFNPTEACMVRDLVIFWPLIMLCDVVGVLVYFKNQAEERGLERRRRRRTRV